MDMGNKDVKMAHASLFSGIGGAELAASWMGWDNKFHCEINPFCRKILEYHFPESISYEDISKTDFSDWRGQIDVLTGGFPCQPFSLAGKRKGAEDNRYLWPQMLRAIREIRPTWVVGENVAGILTMVQPGDEAEVGNQSSLFGESDRKRVLQRQEYVAETICRDLEREGYSVQPVVIPACSVGAPHRRDRVWFVARRIVADTSRNGDSGRPGAVREEVRRQDYELRAEPFEHGGFQTMAASHPDEHRHTPCQPGEGTERSGRRHVLQPEERGDPTERPYGFPGLPLDAANTDSDKLQRECFSREAKEKRWKDENRRFEEYSGNDRATLPAYRWKDFPTQSPIRSRYDGISANVVRYIKQEVYDKIGENIGREDLSGLWKAFQKKEIREKIGRSYEIPEPDLLLKVLQCSSSPKRNKQREIELSPFSEETSERVLRVLRKYGTFRCSPFGQKYKEQFTIQFGDSLPQLSHEIALATKKIIEECEITASKVRQESIKAYGNAWVPQVAYEIFMAIGNVMDM